MRSLLGTWRDRLARARKTLARARRPDWRRSNAHRFGLVYTNRFWDVGGSASGPGSDRGSPSVDHALRVLEDVADRFAVRSIADIPCGDFNWIGGWLATRPGIDYTGYDIVPDLIARNRQDWPGFRFELLDVTRRKPARADLIFCKDLINHQRERDVRATLANMAASGSEWLLITSNRGAENVDLDLFAPGASRPLDLCAPPYDLPPPVMSDHYLSLWRLADVAAHLARRGDKPAILHRK